LPKGTIDRVVYDAERVELNIFGCGIHFGEFLEGYPG
jgi:hypothetical protein